MPCGSTGPSGPTSGCSTTRRAPRRPVRAACPGGPSSPETAGWPSRSSRRAWSAWCERLKGAPSAFLERGVVAFAIAGVELAGAGDLRALVQKLAPVGEPSRGPGYGEERGEHVDRKADGLVDEARVEVDVGIEAAGGEVLVGQRPLLQLESDVEQRVLACHFEHLVRRALDDAGPGVVVLVHAVAEALEATLPPL